MTAPQPDLLFRGVRVVDGTGRPAAANQDVRVSEGRIQVSPLNAIAAAILHCAVGLRMDDEIGTVAPGKVTDLPPVDGDAATDITALRRVVLVVRGGQRVAVPGSVAVPQDASPSRLYQEVARARG